MTKAGLQKGSVLGPRHAFDPFGLLECVSNYLSLCASAGPGHFGMGAGHGPGGGGGGGFGGGDDGDDDW